MGQSHTGMAAIRVKVKVSVLFLFLTLVTIRASPHPLLNFLLSGEKEEKLIEEEFAGPPCTVPEVTQQKVVCVAGLETHCNNVYEDYCITEQVGEECRKEVTKTVCRPVGQLDCTKIL